MNMSSQFYPGQLVVCIQSHSKGCTVKGNEYVVNDTQHCNCGIVRLDLGIHVGPGKTGSRCDCGRETDGTIWWQGGDRFRPAEPLKEEMDRLEKEGAPVELETIEALAQ